MDMRDVMTRDFDVVDAGWSLERIRAAADKIPCPWIIVRRGAVSGISRIYYVSRRDEIVNRLKAARGADVRQALYLHETGAINRFIISTITRARNGLNSLSVLTLRSKSAKIRPPAMRSQDPEGHAVPSARSVA